MRKLIILLIKVYKLALSPFLGQNCRFHPGCANYAIEAVDRYGVFKGGWLALKRLGRCQPWNEGGYDPVPDHPGNGHQCKGSVSRTGLPTFPL